MRYLRNVLTHASCEQLANLKRTSREVGFLKESTYVQSAAAKTAFMYVLLTITVISCEIRARMLLQVMVGHEMIEF